MTNLGRKQGLEVGFASHQGTSVSVLFLSHLCLTHIMKIWIILIID